jgi:hypothetical protein
VRLPPRFELRLAPRARWPWIAILASVLVHSALLFGWVTGRLPTVPRLPHQLIVLAPPSDGTDQVPMRFEPPRAMTRNDRAPGESPQGTRARPAVRPELPPPSRPVPALPERQPRAVAADTGSAPRRSWLEPPGRIGAGLGEGQLWVRPLPLPPRELAERLTQNRAQLVDSAVTAIVQRYLDSIANDPATRGETLPSWTTEVAGKKFGLDSKNIYVAGLKIPAAVLALIPIPVGNIDQNRAYNHFMDLRGDLMYAAQRAATLEEFKIMIREMRERKEREREFQRNQRTAPPPEKPPTP